MRTTLDIDKPILDELKRLQKTEKKPLGQIASALLAEGMANRRGAGLQSHEPVLEWVTANMGATVDLGDKDAVYKVLDES